MQQRGEDDAEEKAEVGKAEVGKADEQHYQDDLRTGAFEFQVRDTTSTAGQSTSHQPPQEKPLPYQVNYIKFN